MIIRIEASSGIPIWRQIADQIGAQCLSGALISGDRLPSVRALAAELAVNQNTVLHVYERLAQEGLLERRHGDGTFVAARLPLARLQERQQERLAEQVQQLVYKAQALGVSPRAIRKMLDDAFKAPGVRPPTKETADD